MDGIEAKEMVSPRPDAPGKYFWDQYGCVVDVYRRGPMLYVKPPGGIEVRISKRIAGIFIKQEKRHGKQ